MKFDVKQAIIDRLRDTRRKNVEMVVDYMEKHGFFTLSCRGHHKYEGGLADHAWQTYQIALGLDADAHRKNPNFSQSDADSIAISALLHDICKCSGLRDIKGHGGRSRRLLKRIGFELNYEESLAIRFHMSLRNKVGHREYDDALKSQLRYVIHKADGISAKLHKGYNETSKKAR